MHLLRDKRAALKFSMLIVGIFALVLIGVYASSVIGQEDVDVGILSHDSHAELQPEWSVPSVTNDYTVEIFNDDGDSIDEVRIMQNNLYTGFVCDVKADWTLVFVPNFPDPELGIIDMCWYFTDDAHAIPDGDSEIFTFEATAPSEDPEECFLKWKFETRDINDFWHTIYDTTNIDSEAPETTKTLGNPFYTDGTSEWITTDTLITLSAEDLSEECGIGVDKTWYMNVIDLTEESCWHPEDNCRAITEFDTNFIKSSPRDEIGCVNWAQDYCVGEEEFEPNTEDWYDCVEYWSYDECGVDPVWKLYRGVPIEKDEESCHIFQYFSVDYLGNAEEYQVNCFFVDDTPPVVAKDNGQAIEGFDEQFSETDGIFHWINPDMPVTFICRDPDPHGVKNEELCFKVSYDYPEWGYITGDYCDDPLEDDYCCVDATPDNPYLFYFNENEDSAHNLEYFCKDGLGNEAEEHIQYYKVDSQPPIISKDMLGVENEDWLGDCPSGTDLEHGDCFVADNGRGGVHISVKDDDTYPQCVVDNVQCSYKLWWEVSSEECDDHGEWIFGEGCLVDSDG
ncbi:MAG: hypothetical protein ABIE22_00625, partial [archaeon]